MNLDTLLHGYRLSPLFQQTAEILLSQSKEKGGRLRLKGLEGSTMALLISTAFTEEKLSGLNHLIILNDAEEAAYFHNTIENITGALDLFYFPSSFKTKKDFQRLNTSHVMLRTEMLTRLTAPATALSSPEIVRRKIIVTYPEALFEKVVLPDTLHGNTIFIKVNDTIQPDSLMELLVMYGFMRTDFVFEPGQFALRGGILDIYSYGNEKPYRIELFGNEVDSIRIFDPESQLSERKLLQVTVIPNVETQFDTKEKTDLLSFLPENTVIWIKDWEFIRNALEEQELALELFRNSGRASINTSDIDDKSVFQSAHEDVFTPLQRLSDQLLHRCIIEFGHNSFWCATGSNTIHFNTTVQPSFNRNFAMLIADLKLKEANGYKIYLFAEQARQLERLYSIFTDLETEIQFIPIATSIHEGFIDHDQKNVCYTDHQIFQRYHKYRVRQAYSKNKAITLRALRDLQPGDFVTHIDHGVGRYSGLQKIEVAGHVQEAIRIIYKDNDVLYVNINSLHKVSKFTGKDGTEPRISKLGSEAWSKLKEKTKAKVKEIAFDLIKLYAERKAQRGFAHSPDNYIQTELEASFIYEDTPDQSRATADVKKDMESDSPMDRLVCGDVGFGKTEIAVRAACKTCIDGKQAAVLVPTTILAFQHYQTFKERLKDFPVVVDYVNRFKTAKEKKETYKRLEEGKIDIIIGTHALLAKDVVFKNLGLMIIDEEQKFGVGHKEKLKTLKTTVDCLTLTATPIPRTLQFSLMGARDLSIMNTAPPNRQPIQTEVVLFQEDFIRDAIYFETERGGQVFLIHNRIQGLQEMASLVSKLCPDVSVSFAHGQMEGHDLEERILDFIDRKYDVLVCTNIVESGVDISNVNTIIITNAHQFGLSDLHQLRGRVGRSNKKAFCYLMAPPMSTLPADSRKRLQTLEQFSELGSGFQIAMRDLDIRGAGNLLGGEQTGFITDIGFETYQKILDEAIRELKRSSFKDVFKEEISKQDDFVSDCTIDTDFEIHIPDTYVENVTERLALYTRLNETTDEAELESMRVELSDRFGSLPVPVEDLFTTMNCRKDAVYLGFEKMTVKENTLRCYFINKNDSPYFESDIFKNILDFLQKGTIKARLKQVGKNFFIIAERMQSINDVAVLLQQIRAWVREKAIP